MLVIAQLEQFAFDVARPAINPVKALLVPFGYEDQGLQTLGEGRDLPAVLGDSGFDAVEAVGDGFPALAEDGGTQPLAPVRPIFEEA